jgi:hypothetical protein
MLEIVIILLLVVFVILLICALTETTEPRCINCDKLTDPAPCGAMLCKDCCNRCKELKTKPCRHIKKQDGSIMNGQEWD